MRALTIGRGIAAASSIATSSADENLSISFGLIYLILCL